MEYAIWVVLAMLTVLTGVGIWHARRVKTGEDFALAGRSLHPVVMIGTLVATWIGTGSVFGNAEFTWNHGAVAFFLPIAGGAGILMLAFLAPRARALPADSVPAILGLRYGRAAQILGALALIGAYLVIVSYQFRAGAAIAARMITLPEGFDPDMARTYFVLGFAVFVILYTVLAGMISVAWTDLFNGVVMSVGLVVALIVLWTTWDRTTHPVPTNFTSAGGDQPVIAWAGLLLPAFLLVLGDANLYQRFMSADSPRTARTSAIGMFVGVVILEICVIGLAFVGRALVPEGSLDNPGHVIIELAFNHLPVWLGLLIVASATAVIVTTADSYLLGSSTSVAVDIAGRRAEAVGPGLQRAAVLALGFVAIGLAFTSDSFFRVALYAYTIYGATLTPAVVCALLKPKTPPLAIVLGMASGLTVALGWQIASGLDALPESVAAIDAVLPALGVHLAVLGIGSLIFKAGDGGGAGDGGVVATVAA